MKKRRSTTHIANPPVVARLPWEVVLQCPAGSSLEVVSTAWDALSKQFHPDSQAFGDREKFQAVQDAWADAQKHFGKA